MAHKVSDFLDGHALLAHDRNEGVPQFARRPVRADSSVLVELLERSAHVRSVQRPPLLHDEHQPVVLPSRPGDQPLLRLPGPMCLQRLHRRNRQPQRPARVFVFTSPCERTERNTATFGGTGGTAFGTPSGST
jgi:hypothetical protein